jgi:Icc-related predicted phosphoesterase
MLKLVHISDTHLREFNIEPGDILVHSGDALNYGDMQDLIQFRIQLEKIEENYNLIIFVPGNHDRIFENNFDLAVNFLKETIPNIEVLHNRALEYKGLKFYGTADQPKFCDWAFNKSSKDLDISYAKIPDDVEVLITHCPAKGIRDMVYGKSVGSFELATCLPNLKKLQAHLFGHIHYSAGLDKVNDIWYSNGSMVDERYVLVNKENIIELEVKDVP